MPTAGTTRTLPTSSSGPTGDLRDVVGDATGNEAKEAIREALAARIAAEVERKGQVVLYGPPGTGRTYHAVRSALELTAWSARGRARRDLSEPERDGLLGGGEADDQRVWTCTFHPAYGYEDFVEGLRPVAVAGGLSFEPRPGLFRNVCAAAVRRPRRPARRRLPGRRAVRPG